MHYTPKPHSRRRGLLIAVGVAVAAIAVVVALPTWRDPAQVAIVDSPSGGARSDAQSESASADGSGSASATVADTGAGSSAPTATSTTTTTPPPPPPPPTTTTTKPKPTTTVKPKPQVPTGTDPAEAEVLAIVNTERSKAGCGALRWNDTLALAARKHSADMAANNYFDHTSQDGRSPFDRMKAEGYTKGGGENIAAGQSTPESVMKSWMESPGHKANILNCKFGELGVGMAKGGSYRIYWTQAFGYA